MHARRRLAAGLAAAALAIPLAAAVPASAAPAGSHVLTGNFYMYNQGAVLDMQDAGHNVPALMESGSTYWFEVGEGGGWFELEDGANRCLDIGSNEVAYPETCSGATTEQFSKSGYLFENRHYGLYLTCNGGYGSDVYTDVNQGADSMWSTPGA